MAKLPLTVLLCLLTCKAIGAGHPSGHIIFIWAILWLLIGALSALVAASKS